MKLTIIIIKNYNSSPLFLRGAVATGIHPVAPNVDGSGGRLLSHAGLHRAADFASKLPGVVRTSAELPLCVSLGDRLGVNVRVSLHAQILRVAVHGRVRLFGSLGRSSDVRALLLRADLLGATHG